MERPAFSQRWWCGHEGRIKFDFRLVRFRGLLPVHAELAILGRFFPAFLLVGQAMVAVLENDGELIIPLVTKIKDTRSTPASY